jgi:hypothetical protein
MSVVVLSPDADTSTYDTILNLFKASPQSQPALTDWDLSYLQALYGAELNQRAVNQQGGEVANSMFRDRQRAQPDDEERPVDAEAEFAKYCSAKYTPTNSSA